jgi:hypothetical protein
MLPYYADIGRNSLSYLAERALPPSIKLLLILAMLIVIARRRVEWESAMLASGIAFGLASYFAQGKGFPYHRYPALAFALIWVAVEFANGMKVPGFARLAAATGMIAGTLAAPLYLKAAVRSHWDEAYNNALSADLNKLGGTKLSGSVQCFTTPADCDTVLYRMRLVQASGLFYDYFIFGPGDEPVIQRARDEVWRQLGPNPPQVLIVGRWLYPERSDDEYEKLERWPQLNELIAAHYTLYDDRQFNYAECGFRGFRVYVRKPAEEERGPSMLQAAVNARRTTRNSGQLTADSGQ